MFLINHHQQLLQEEIVDETDTFIDNHQKKQVNASMTAGTLPPRLRAMLNCGAFTPRIGRLGIAVGKQVPTEIWAHGNFEEKQKV
jgi:hypothetical protein